MRKEGSWTEQNCSYERKDAGDEKEGDGPPEEQEQHTKGDVSRAKKLPRSCFLRHRQKLPMTRRREHLRLL